MTDIEKIYLWNPCPSIPMEILDLDSMRFAADTLEIVLFNEDSKFSFRFSNMIQGLGTFKCTSSHFNLTFNDILGKWLKICNLEKQTYSLFSTDDSNYIRWMQQQSYSTLDSNYKKMKHYIIITLDTIIEIVCCDEPEVSAI